MGTQIRFCKSRVVSGQMEWENQDHFKYIYTQFDGI